MADNVNKPGKITGTDLLASERDERVANSGFDTGNELPTIRGIIPAEDALAIVDSVADPATRYANLSDPVSLSDSQTIQMTTLGAWFLPFAVKDVIAGSFKAGPNSFKIGTNSFRCSHQIYGIDFWDIPFAVVL